MARYFGHDKLPNAHQEWTASDTNELPPLTYQIYVGGAGDVEIVDQYDTSATYTAVPVGTQLNIFGAKKIMATGTTASAFVISYARDTKV